MRSASRTSLPAPGTAHRLLTAGLALLCLAGIVEIHAPAEIMGAGAWQGATLQSTCPPGLATHVEEARTAEQPDCPACLLRLENRGAHLAAAASLAPLLPVRDVLAGAAPRLLAFATPPPTSRGPPAA
jgi:hypothetical protein